MPAPTGRTYQIISSDSHIVEPPDLWEKWLDPKYQDRAPKLVKDAEGGDAWHYDPKGDPAPLGLVVCVHIPREKTAWMGFRYGDNIHPSVHDGKERIKVLDTDGVDAEFLYPPQRAIMSFSLYDDAELMRAGFEAYNQWLAEDFCAADSTRLIPIYYIPPIDLETSVQQLRQAHSLGFRGAALTGWPSGNKQLSMEDDPFWAAAEELGIPISVHFGFAGQASNHVSSREAGGAIGAVAGMQRMSEIVVDMIFEGVFHRHPGMHLVGVEVGVGWLPHAAEMIDDRYWRNRTRLGIELGKLPSQYLKDNFTATFIVDKVGVQQLRHAIGVKSMAWSTDFPHHGNDYPYSRETIDAHFVNVPADERHQIIAGNMVELYGL